MIRHDHLLLLLRLHLHRLQHPIGHHHILDAAINTSSVGHGQLLLWLPVGRVADVGGRPGGGRDHGRLSCEDGALLRRDAHLIDGVHTEGFHLVPGRGVDSRVFNALGKLSITAAALKVAKVGQVEDEREPEE